MKIIDELDKRSVSNMNLQECIQLSQEIREFLIQSVSKTGGHLASNLGTVELTIALHKVFDLPEDRLIWDVGHQSYTHKILTGRKDQFGTLRQKGGLSGFPKTQESAADCFNTGHSSTSISAAYGLARARDLSQKQGRIAAIIGDGALTGGMAFEALNDAGHYKNQFLVVLNDNEMSISKNVGSLSLYLNKIRNRKGYFRLKNTLHNRVYKIPLLGKPIARLSGNFRRLMKFAFVPGMLFEELGFYYVGPVDGHDLEKLCFILNEIKEKPYPVFLHVNTVKGKGYSFAQENPTEYHCIPKFDIDKGVSEERGKRDYSSVAGNCLLTEARENDKIVALTAAMPDSTGLTPFAQEFPARFFDVGIAEQHAVTFGAGLSKGGYLPVFAVYSSFLQRAYDQLLHDVGLQNLHYLFLVDRAGVVGQDGETHQGIYDLTYLSSLPNFQVLAPADFVDLKEMIHYALCEQNGPVAIRYPKGGQEVQFLHSKHTPSHKSELLSSGTDLLLLAVGNMAAHAFCAAQFLQKDGISATVLNVRSVKPLDRETIFPLGQEIKKVITIEDNVCTGGFGSAICRLFSAIPAVKVQVLGYPDQPIEAASIGQLHEKYGLDVEGIYRRAKEFFYER